MKQILARVMWCCLMPLSLGSSEALAQSKGLVNVGHLGGPCNAVRIVGNRAYLVEGYKLTILDITNKTQPLPVGGLVLAFPPKDVAIEGVKAYVAGDQIVQVVDVAVPATPLPQGRIQTTEEIHSITAKAKTVYIAGAQNQIKIYDAGNPTAPISKGSVAISGVGDQVLISGDKLFTLSHESNDSSITLRTLDVRNPETPVLQGSLTLPGSAMSNKLAVSGSTVALTTIDRVGTQLNNVQKMYVIDAHNPTAMVNKKTIQLSPGATQDFDRIDGVGMGGGLVCLTLKNTSWKKMKIYDVSNFAAVREVGNCPIPTLDKWPMTGNIAIAGGYAFNAGSTDGMSIVDLRTPAAPRLALQQFRTANFEDFEVAGNIAYATDEYYRGGMLVLDVSRPEAPCPIGFYPLESGALKLAVAGNRVYLGGRDQLHILDTTHPATPRRLGVYPATPAFDVRTSWVRGVATRGNLVYLSTGGYTANDGNLIILDISNPAKPVEVSRLALPNCGKVALWSNYALVQGNGVAIVDINNPQAPVEVSHLGSWVNPLDLQVAGNRVYATREERNSTILAVYDISNPRAPQSLVELPLDGTSEFTVSGTRLYITHSPNYSSSEELQIYDMSYPGSPGLIDVYPLDSLFSKLAMVGDNIYIGIYEHGRIWQGIRILRNTPVHVFSPGGPATFKGGDAVRLHWKSDLLYAGSGMLLELWNSKGRVALLGYDWSPTGENGRMVTLPLVPVGSDYRLRVLSTWAGWLWDQSQQPFTITGGVMRVLSPNGGENWKAGTRQNVWWKNNPQQAGGTVWIELWRAGQKVMRLGAGVDADGESLSSVWIPPSVAAGTDYKIRVVCPLRADWYDESDGTITIRK